MGYIVPEYYRWPGDLSPSLGLKQLGKRCLVRRRIQSIRKVILFIFRFLGDVSCQFACAASMLEVLNSKAKL